MYSTGDLCEDCKPMTNGDRIRHMTDEQLAYWITDGHDLCDLCQFSTCRPEYECEKGVLEWLRQEVCSDGQRENPAVVSSN